MKTLPFILAFLAALCSPLHAQQAVDTAAMRQALGTAPSSIKADGTRAVDQSGQPMRVFTKAADPERSRTYTKSGIVRINRASGVTDELPYVALPILFRVGTDELLADGVSGTNVVKTAEVLRNLIAQGGSFIIEGHASAEGNADANKELSDRRAKKIQSLLVDGQGIDSKLLIAKGFGSKFATAPASASDSQLQQDRRVLVVRTK